MLTILAGMGVLMGVLTASVAGYTFVLVQTSKKSVERTAHALVDQAVMAEAALQIHERFSSATALVADDLKEVSEQLSQKWGQAVTVEDESAKVNLNRMGYVVGGVLTSAGFPQEVARGFLENYAALQGWVKGRTRSGEPYWYLPDAQLAMQVSPDNPPTPFNQPDQRHIYWERQPAQACLSVEDPFDIQAIMVWGVSEALLTELAAQLTVVPTAGLNVNTAAINRLQAVMNWQGKAILAHDKVARYWDEFLVHSPAALANRAYAQQSYLNWLDSYGIHPDMLNQFYGDDWLDEGVSVEKRWYRDRGVGKPSAQVALGPRFRHTPVTSANIVINGNAKAPPFEKSRRERPYTNREVVQELGVYPFLKPMSPLIGWDFLEAVHIVVQGPGPYVATSEYYTIRRRTDEGTVRLTWHLAVGGPRPLKRTVTSE